MVPLWAPKYQVPYYIKDPKQDINFDNHPYDSFWSFYAGSCNADVGDVLCGWVLLPKWNGEFQNDGTHNPKAEKRFEECTRTRQ